MKKSLVAIFVCVMALLCPSFVLGQFGMGCCCPDTGCCPAGLPGMSCRTVRNVTVVPWVGFGYQSLGLNVNHKAAAGAPQGSDYSYFSNFDVRLKNNALWIGSLGLDLCLRQCRFFAGAGTNLFVSNDGSLGPVGHGGTFNTSSTLDWQCDRSRWWELNVGGMYCLTDDVAILIGYKCDSLSEKPQQVNFVITVPELGTGSDRLSADFQAITQSPYIGVKICQCNFDLSLVWSPFTSYCVKTPLSINGDPAGYARWSIGDTWELCGGGGNLLEAFAQAKFNISDDCASISPCAGDSKDLGVNLWLRGSWLQCRGDGKLDQSGAAQAPPIYGPVTDLSGSRSGEALFTRYLWALGISGQLSF